MFPQLQQSFVAAFSNVLCVKLAQLAEAMFLAPNN